MGITALQILGIGFSFGIAGPCFFFCTPVLITYIIGRKERGIGAVADILVFLIGRLSAYILLGALAGLSGAVLKQFLAPSIAAFINPITGGVSIILGILVLIHKEPPACACGESPSRKIYGYGSLLALGFILGVNPCPPLTALLLEIALMSKSVFEGAFYAFFFGLGTLLSGLLVVGILTGLIGGLVKKIFRSAAAIRFFRLACGGLLIMLGLWIIARGIIL